MPYDPKVVDLFDAQETVSKVSAEMTLAAVFAPKEAADKLRRWSHQLGEVWNTLNETEHTQTFIDLAEARLEATQDHLRSERK